MKSSTLALLSTSVATTLGIGYYYYHRSTTFTKQQQEGQALKLIEKVITASSQEVYPQTPETKEQYMLEQVSTGESLCLQGHYNDAVLPFYKALKVYPELIDIYQTTIPEPVFQYIASILLIEQKAVENQQDDSPEFAAAAATGCWH